MCGTGVWAIACGSDEPRIGPDTSTSAAQGGSSASQGGSSAGQGGATSGQGGATSGQGGATTGSGGDDLPGLGYENGTRLRARVFASSDGARQFETWHDNQRNEDCSFRTAADGTLRCMPAARFSPYFAAGSSCQTPIYAHIQPSGTCVPLPTYLEAPGLNVCNNPTLHARGATITAPGTVMQRVYASCSTISAPFGTYYSLGPAIAASEFVEAQSELE
jgi:hypothetical protein